MAAPPRAPPPARLPTLQVSRATARFIAEGHPWVRPDRFTRGLGALAPGQAITLVDEDGKRLASALADPRDKAVCARVFHRKPDMAFDPGAAINRAWQRRAELHADPATDCYRVVHGEGDFVPALRVERYGSVLVVLVFAECIARHVPAIVQALAGCMPGATIVVREHRDDLRREDVTTRRVDGLPLDPEAVVVARELGVAYPLRPFAGLATGLYVDQRATRAWLGALVRDARVLNLFAYTGAFSLAALAAGARAALDVDLAGPALERASEAAALNGLLERHAIERADCRRFLASASSTWDVIVVDPPTAAQGGDSGVRSEGEAKGLARAGGWVLRRDYPELLRLALARLAPGGLLVAACNTLGKPYPLGEAVHDAARAARVRLVDVPSPPLGADLPQLQGFPEGRPHRLVCVRSLAP